MDCRPFNEKTLITRLVAGIIAPTKKMVFAIVIHVRTAIQWAGGSFIIPCRGAGQRMMGPPHHGTIILTAIREVGEIQDPNIVLLIHLVQVQKTIKLHAGPFWQARRARVYF